jgi:hypothetical protein
MDRREFIKAAAITAGGIGVESKSNLPIVKFKNNHIDNINELFDGVYLKKVESSKWIREIKVWIEKIDCVLHLDEFWWGEVTLRQHVYNQLPVTGVYVCFDLTDNTNIIHVNYWHDTLDAKVAQKDYPKERFNES